MTRLGRQAAEAHRRIILSEGQLSEMLDIYQLDLRWLIHDFVLADEDWSSYHVDDG